MTGIAKYLSVVLLAGAAWAQEPTTSCTIEGTVTDATTALPVAGAALIVNNGRQTNVVDSATDAAGKFTLHLGKGVYSIVASARQYSRQTLAATCGVGAQRALAFTLSPEAMITGRVSDADGAAAPGARITLLRTVYASGEKRLAVQGGAVAGEDGQFSLDNLSTGVYFVLATASEKITKNAKKPEDQVYVPTFYPSAIDAAAAAPVHIRGPGEVGGTDIRLAKARAFAVRGALLGAGVTDSVRDFVVTLLPSDRRTFGPSSPIRDEKGRFEFSGIVPGSYTLVAHRVGAIVPAGRLKIDLGDADLNDIELPLNAGVTATGILLYEDKSPTSMLATQITLQPWDEASNAFQINAVGGQFRLNGIPLGTYRLSVARLSRQTYTKSLRIDGQDVPDWIADLSSAGPHTVEIVLGSDAGSVSGYVRNSSGDPAAKIFVTLVPAGSVPLTGPQYATTYSDSQGRYTFTGVQPGAYKLYAWEKVTAGAVQNRDVLSQFSTQSSDAQVPAGGSVTADVAVIGATATASIE